MQEKREGKEGVKEGTAREAEEGGDERCGGEGGGRRGDMQRGTDQRIQSWCRGLRREKGRGRRGDREGRARKTEERGDGRCGGGTNQRLHVGILGIYVALYIALYNAR